MKCKIYYALLILVIAFVVLITYNYFFVYHVELNGKENQVINIYSGYKELGAAIKYRGKAIKDYKIEDNLNINKLGSYTVKYIVGNTIKYRNVFVKDIEKPVIDLEGEAYSTLEYNTEYIEPGFKATDNYDGDLTDKVLVENNINTTELGEYLITYKVSDSSKNETNIIRKIKVVDTEGPVIKFKSNNTNTFSIVGNKVDLDDFEATDNYDGDLTDKVTIDGDVDFDKEGLYVLNYSVEDSNGNKTTVKRRVSVQEKNNKGIPVLMYHWFYDDTKGETAGRVNTHNYIARTELEKQLKYVTDNNFYFPTWEELIKYIDNDIELPSKSVIFTDDDCDESFFDVALPLFQQYQIPVTSYCITRKDYWKNFIGEEYLDFESHTDDLHTRMCSGVWDGAVMCSSYDEINADIKKSVEKVKNTWSFAYPFGHYNDNTIKALKENDIKLAFTINSGRVKRNANKYKLPRVRISRGTSISQYENLID